MEISKIVFLVKVRLDPKKPFREIETHSRLPSIKEAERRVDEWYASIGDLSKAQPEATIEALELPLLAHCFICHAPRYRGDVVWRTLEKVYCSQCSYEHDTGQGFFDLLGEPL